MLEEGDYASFYLLDMLKHYYMYIKFVPCLTFGMKFWCSW